VYNELRRVLTALNGIKGVEAEEKIQIEDIAEIVAHSLEVQQAHVQN
jgi:hypothetical protein